MLITSPQFKVCPRLSDAVVVLPVSCSLILINLIAPNFTRNASTNIFYKNPNFCPVLVKFLKLLNINFRFPVLIFDIFMRPRERERVVALHQVQN